MPFDPTLPVEYTLIDATELRAQFNALKTLLDDVTEQFNDLNDRFTNFQTETEAQLANRPTFENLNMTINDTAANVNGVEASDIDFSDPPAVGELNTLRDKLNELIGALHR